MIGPISRAQSHLSLKDNSLPFNYHGSVHSGFASNQSRFEQNNIYSHANVENFEEFLNTRRVPAVRQSHREVDNYSQLMVEDDAFNGTYIMNYGDVDIQKDTHCFYNEARCNTVFKPPSSCDINAISYPFSLKSENHLGSILASTTEISHTHESTVKNVYKTVEYSRSCAGDEEEDSIRIVKPLDNDSNDNQFAINESFEECSAQAYKIDAKNQMMRNLEPRDNYAFSEETQSKTVYCTDEEFEERNDKYVLKLNPVEERQ